MSFFSMLSTLLIGPLKLFFEIVFTVANNLICNPGLAIIVLSLVMNFLVLPLYRRADAMQEEARDQEAKLHDGVAHIKKTFSGDERMMILQTYYRQNHYKPTDALNGSVSLLLEVPFFMAAYQFLSNLEVLQGAALGPIGDLRKPDGLLMLGSLSINVLPILMTLINVISSAIYLKGFPTKTKVQLYAMALFFLVFLYGSPAGLVFYWTLNNIFSLIKTLFYKMKNPRRILRVLASAAGLILAVLVMKKMEARLLKYVVIAMCMALQLPLLVSLLRGRLPFRLQVGNGTPNRKLFLLSGIFLTVLVGLLIPSAFIADSPHEFVDLTYFYNPLWYIVSALCLAAGTFLVWGNVFYWLASPKGKVLFERFFWIACGAALVNYMFFGTDLGVITPNLQYEAEPYFSFAERFSNLGILAVLGCGLYLLVVKKPRAAQTALLLAIFALGGMSVWNAVTIQKSIHQVAVPEERESPNFRLSKTGQNVVVIMLDRAMGGYVPYIFQEKPELMEQFSGFTYYDNVISYGRSTNFGSPALFGGYEYTPVELNKRNQERLVDKQNEALKVMPVTFLENGFDVTVCDPTYANYQWIPDLSIYDDYPEIQTYITKGTFNEAENIATLISNRSRNFFCFGLMKSMPLFLQAPIYNHGQYNQSVTPQIQVQYDRSTSEGISADFMGSYNVLCALSGMTRVSEEETNTFLMLTNDTTHEPMLLQEPDYSVSYAVDNTEYDAAHEDRFTVDGKTLRVESPEEMIHYHANMAAMLRLGEWFDDLRKNGVYDNTRIILVADHGAGFGQIKELIMDDGSHTLRDASWYFPLLMVKDFDSEGFATSSAFMTNADVPVLAMEDLIADPVNPFTGLPITDAEKTAHDQYIIMGWEWNTDINNGNTFLPAMWASVHSNIWEKENWAFYMDTCVLDEHALPSDR